MKKQKMNTIYHILTNIENNDKIVKTIILRDG